MTNNQREQNSDEVKAKMFRKMGIDEVGGTTAIGIDQVEVGYLLIEYICDEGDLVLHFFWKEPPLPTHPPVRVVEHGLPVQDNYADWPDRFRELMWNTLIETFNLEYEHSRLDVDWIAELCSWFVCVKGVATIMRPPQSLIEKIAARIVSDLSS